MLNYFLLSFFCVFCLSLSAQESVSQLTKQPLSLKDLDQWNKVDDAVLSADGNCILYTEKGYQNSSLIITTIYPAWQKRIENCYSRNASITPNSRFVIAKVNDTLLIISLLDNKERKIERVKAYQCPVQGDDAWVAIQCDNEKREVIALNLVTGKEKHFSNVDDYLISNNGNSIILKQKLDNGQTSLIFAGLHNDEFITVWKGGNVEKICFDNSGNQFAFIASDPCDSTANAIWAVHNHTKQAEVIIDCKTKDIPSSLTISPNELSFNLNGDKLFFHFKAKSSFQIKNTSYSVDVWSYLDIKPQSEQLSRIREQETYLAVVNIKQDKDREQQNKVLILEESGDQRSQFNPYAKLQGRYFIFDNRQGNVYESNWNRESMTSVNLVNTEDGKRITLRHRLQTGYSGFTLTPDEKYVVGYDRKKGAFIAIEAKTGKERIISSDVKVSLIDTSEGQPLSTHGMPYSSTVSLMVGGNCFIIASDEYDIWQLDPSGIQKSLCLTNGYGRKNGIAFRLLESSEVHFNDKARHLTVTAFDKRSKENGFYSIQFGKEKDPQKLTMGAYLYYTSASSGGSLGFNPIKAKKNTTYLVMRMNAQQPPNFFVTTDFREFKQISNLSFREKNCNWFTTTLLEWQTLDHKRSQGILYKPENFDSTKKYPLIFNFYEKRSDRLNQFLYPEFSNAEINIPYFVSNGYLVFCPDIQYTFGYPGESAFNSVLGATNMLKQFSYVDSTKMGLNGLSFGGYQVNYLVTRTSAFAAAVSASGLSDFVSGYGSLRGAGNSQQYLYENGQNRLGGTLWQKVNLYLQNSPIFRADKVTTPILIMANLKDPQVPYQHGLEWFLALRRLGRKAWMIQYENGYHGVYGQDRKDWTMRMKQFYDHYLKDAPAPKWMTRGVPAKRKGLDEGFQLDQEIKTPGTGLVLDIEN